jgi:diadenosine tetraphosphate (Ap4A) HIT family hydrolase
MTDLKKLSDEEIVALIKEGKVTNRELTDSGICPTCFNREHNGALYGDNKDKLIYEDIDIECFFVGNPRADGHMCISSIEHYHDLSEAPDYINEKIIRFAKQFMIIIKEVYKCERVYMCTMCDGPNNHYHIQLIPRYSYEKRGSKNFVKERQSYVYDEVKFNKVKEIIRNYVGE